MKKGTKSRWVCMRECFGDNRPGMSDKQRVWTPGEIVTDSKPPASKHFRRLYQNESSDPVDIVRGILEDKEIEYDEDWDHNELVRRLNDFELDERKRERAKSSLKNQEISRIEEERMKEEVRKEVEEELKAKYGKDITVSREGDK